MTIINRKPRQNALLGGIVLFLYGALAHAQTDVETESERIEEIRVTGSRTISDPFESPTPVTQVTAEDLETLAVTNIPDALNNLPAFEASTDTQSFGSLKRSNNGNYMNLRAFGIIRSLTLLDGRRVTPTNPEGTVDANILPQMLISQVEIVTGGASAVYGADAVTGVSNWILDKSFEGLKLEAQGGTSGEGDSESYRFGIAAGTSIFDGRGHIEGSYLRYENDGLPVMADRRPHGEENWTTTGTGTAENPFVLTANARSATSAFNPMITTGPLDNYVFNEPNVPSPFDSGIPTGSGGISIGGDGSWFKDRTLISPLTQDQVFGLASIDVTSNVRAFVQANVARSEVNSAFYGPGGFDNVRGATDAEISVVDNPYTPASIASTYLNAGETTLEISSFLNQPYMHNETTDENVMITGGLNGAFNDRFDWEIYYTHGENEQEDLLPNNVNYNRVVAALDTINQGGEIVCRVTVTNPGDFSGCIPLNPFVPTDLQDPAAIDWVTQSTYFNTTYKMDDFSASISGDVLELPAGPLTMALTGELRSIEYEVESTADPDLVMNCDGIMYGCSTSYSVWATGNVPAAIGESDIWEVAAEANVPILENLSVNGAVRYADYSPSSPGFDAPGFDATTWKVGLEWRAFGDVRFRGTVSRDVRAPALSEMFTPEAPSSAGFTDLHTGVSSVATLISGGNPDLVPEEGDTYTVGFVYTPESFPGFSLSVDYFDINLENAIVGFQGQAVANQQLCEESNGTSPVCDLYVRPLPFSDRSPANFPTIVYTRLINAAQRETRGFDTEVAFSTEFGDASMLDARLLVTYQPVNSETIPGQDEVEYAGTVPQGNPSTSIGGAEWRATFLGTYSNGPFSLRLVQRYRSSLKRSANQDLVFADGEVSSYAPTNLTLSYDGILGSVFGSDMDSVLFLNVENVFDKEPPLFADTLFATAVGGFYPAVPGESPIGRYFTLGLRMRF